LHADADTLRIAAHAAWRIDIDTDRVTVYATGQDPRDDLSVVRATAHAVWEAELDPAAFTVSAGDDTARAALQRWSLLSAPID
jgi:hypothetical protein